MANRKIRAEGEKLDNMLDMLKKMEECMRLTEGLRFKKKRSTTTNDADDGDQPQQTESPSTGAPGEIWRAVNNKRAEHQNRIRSIKNMCQI